VAVNGGDKAGFHGNLKAVELFDQKKLDSMNPNELAQGLLGIPLGIVGDGLAGAGGAKLGKNIRGHLSKSTGQKILVKEFENSGVKNPREATKITMETAKSAKETQTGLNKNVNGVTSKAVDTATGKSGVGHSGKIRNEIRAQEGGFPSKSAARNANDYGTPSHLQQKHPNVQPTAGRSVPQNACAEQAAFTEYNKNNPGYDVGKTRTATVGNKKGNFATMKRCDNCSEYGDAMGDVVTDKVPHGTPVPARSYVAAGPTVEAVYAAAGGILILQTNNKR
jgi:hypothetical protein